LSGSYVGRQSIWPKGGSVSGSLQGDPPAPSVACVCAMASAQVANPTSRSSWTAAAGGVRRKKTAAERREQRLRSEGRALIRLAKALDAVRRHRGNAVGPLGAALLDAFQARAEASKGAAAASPNPSTAGDGNRTTGVPQAVGGPLWQQPLGPKAPGPDATAAAAVVCPLEPPSVVSEVRVAPLVAGAGGASAEALVGPSSSAPSSTAPATGSVATGSSFGGPAAISAKVSSRPTPMQVDKTGEGDRKRAREDTPTSSGECGLQAALPGSASAASPDEDEIRTERVLQTLGELRSRLIQLGWEPASQAPAAGTPQVARRVSEQAGRDSLEIAREAERRAAEDEAQRPAAGRRRRGKW
jgi:hypothetical protein